MEEPTLLQPELVGREEELDRLRRSLSDAIAGNGSTTLISGEAGVGKTRLVSEIIENAESEGARVIRGWCLAESLEPLMAIKTALREANLAHLISGAPPPLVVSAYLINEAGMLIAKVEREESGLDSDIFASMLQAVGNFVQDSLSMMDKGGGSALNSLGYGDYTILIQTAGAMSLAMVIKGANSEFLLEDMKRTLNDIGDRFDGWSGNDSETTDVQPKILWFVESGKYDGKFLVDDPKIKQENLFDNVLLGLQRASKENLNILFLDDLQWADPTTLNLLHYLSRNTRKSKILILGTYRQEDVMESEAGKPHHLETTMQNMSRENLFEKIELDRLGPDETKRIIKSALGKESFQDNFFDRTYRETEGTPFFVLEILKLLIDDKAITQDGEGVWKLVADIETLDIPSKVYDVIKRRLDRLIKEQRDLLECASVIGEEFTTDVLEKTTDIRKIALLKNLSEIEKNHQLIHYLQDKYRFNHRKVRDVLYNGIGEELRKEYHRIVGDTIEELNKDNLDDVLSDLAHQYLMAKDKKAKGYLVMAGNRAKERYANEEAIQFYEHAIELIETDDELKATYDNLGHIYALIGDNEKAIENYLAAYELESDNLIKANLHDKFLIIHDRTGDYRKGKEECEKGLQLIGDQEVIEKARLLIGLGGLFVRTGDFETAVQMSSEGLAIAKKLGATKDAARAQHMLGLTHFFEGDIQSALEHLEICLKIYNETKEIAPISTIQNNIGLFYRDLGKLDEAMELFEQGVETSERLGDKWGISSSLNNLGLIYRDKGDLDKALEIFEKSLGIAEMIADKLGIGLRYYNIGEVYTLKGEIPKSLEYLEKALALFLETENIRSIIECHCNLAYAHLKTEEKENALEHAKKAVDLSTEIGAKGLESMSHLCLATTLRELKDYENAINELEITQKLLDEVRDIHTESGLYYEYGLLFKDRGEKEKAKENLEKALSMFEEMGMMLWIEEVRKALES